jgi:hypothetical protein
MAIKVKELKEDALMDIKVNKAFYLMLKSTLFYLFNQITDVAVREESLKKVMAADYGAMNDWERSFYTITVMLAEIEKVAGEASLFDEKEILEPGDAGYVEPTQG